MAHRRFKISTAGRGQVTFNLTASNGEVIEQRAVSLAGDGIAAVKANAPIDER